MGVAVATLAVGSTALHAATHSPACRGRVKHAACALRLCVAATGQFALAHARRMEPSMPASMLGFLIRRNQPMLHFGSAATLRTRNNVGGLLTYVAVVGGELAIYVGLQACTCRCILSISPGAAWFYDRIAAAVHAAALVPVVGSGAADAAACRPAGCTVAQTFCFALASILGAAASSCGGGRRVIPAGVCVGGVRERRAGGGGRQTLPCPPLEAWHAAVLAAGQPVARPIARGRVRFHARYITDDVVTVLGFVAAGVREAVGRALMLF